MGNFLTGKKQQKDKKIENDDKKEEKNGEKKLFQRNSSLGKKDFPKPIEDYSKKKLHIDDFQIIKVLGKGAFGEVRLCRKRDTQELLAIKIMVKKNLKSSQIPRLLAERDLMAFAEHEHIVPLHYSFQDEKKLYLVMDFMQGGDLMALLIEKDIFSVKATVFYMGELCLAVHSVHLLGYCHRDLKPDNVLLTADGHVKLADFGLAKKLTGYTKVDKNTQKKSVESKDNIVSDNADSKAVREQWKLRKKAIAYSMVGTPDYMAPEIFTSDGYDEECDWWGVGCIMFECLAGYAPFYSGGEQQDTVYNVRNWSQKLNLDKIRETDKNALDIISKLICHFKVRLNFQGIKEHKFFAKFDWENYHANKAPYHKIALTDETDTRYFNSYSDDDDDDDQPQINEPVQNVEGFTFYVNKSEDVHNVTDLWIHDNK